MNWLLEVGDSVNFVEIDALSIVCFSLLSEVAISVDHGNDPPTYIVRMKEDGREAVVEIGVFYWPKYAIGFLKTLQYQQERL